MSPDAIKEEHYEAHHEERRKGYVALSDEFIEELKAHVVEENTLFRSLRLASYVFSALVAIIVWVLLEKNGDIKDMQANIARSNVSIEKTLTILEHQVIISRKLTEAHEKLEDRFDKHVEKGR